MGQQPSAPPKPMTIGSLSNAVHSSFAFLAGCQLEVFSALGNGPKSADEIAESLGVKVAKLRPLLYALVAAGLLNIEGDKFFNTEESDFYLVKGKPTYIGGMHELLSTLWEAEMQTAGSIRTGTPLAKHDYRTSSKEELEKVFRGLHPRAIGDGRMLTQQYDFSNHRSLLDIGGGSGGTAIGLLGALPHMRATIIDLPSVTPITQVFVDRSDVADRIQVKAVNILTDPLDETFDVITMRAFIQVLGPENAKLAIANAGKLLKPNGEIYIVGSSLDDSRISPPLTAGFNLVFLNIYDEGEAYTEQEFRSWMEEAGIQNFTRKVLPDGNNSLIVGRKSA